MSPFKAVISRSGYPTNSSSSGHIGQGGYPIPTSGSRVGAVEGDLDVVDSMVGTLEGASESRRFMVGTDEGGSDCCMVGTADGASDAIFVVGVALGT